MEYQALKREYGRLMKECVRQEKVSQLLESLKETRVELREEKSGLDREIEDWLQKTVQSEKKTESLK